MKNGEECSKNMPYQRNNRTINKRLHGDIVLSPPDTTLMVVVAFLVVIGLMAIFSAGAPKCMEAGENPASFAIKQFAYMIVGLVGLRYFVKLDYKRLKDWAVPFAWFVIIMLALVDFTPLGVVVNGARRWINIGPIQFQPSEMTKLAVIFLLSSAFYKTKDIFDSQKFTKYFLPILIMIFLVYKQPNLSMVILLMLISTVMYLSVSGSVKYMIAAGIAAVSVFVTSFMLFGQKLLHGYQMSRIKIWLNPESDPYGAGYNIIQSLLAFAAGGFWGVGYGNSKQKLAWLPEGHTDFIFAVIGEEFGFIFCVCLILLIGFIIVYGMLKTLKNTNYFNMLAQMGLLTQFGLQALINIASTLHLIPTKGMTLPFISYGGSSMLSTSVTIGMILALSKRTTVDFSNNRGS